MSRSTVVLVIVLASSCPDRDAIAQKLVVGYYPNWIQTTYTHTDVQYQNLTHIAHAFIASNPDGTLEVPYGFLYPLLNQTAHRNGVSVVVSVGGWGDYSTRFSPMVADTVARHKFVAELTKFCVSNNYDGADLDWEYPKTAADRTNLQLLVHELRLAFNVYSPPFFIGMAMPSTGWGGQWYDIASMISDVDWFGVMTYDFYGSWTTKSGPNSPLYGNFSTNTEGWIDYSVDYYANTRGVPAARLLIGLPFYGWMFSASSMYGASTGASQLVYNAIAPKLDQGWVRYWDGEACVPYIVNQTQTQVISYDDTVSIGLKCDYVNSKGVGGVIVWALGQDRLGGRQPLLESVGPKLKTPTHIASLSVAAVADAFQLRQNFPNPFNGMSHIQYTVPRDCFLTLTLYDQLGRVVRILANSYHSRGEHTVTVSSNELSSGVYFYRLRSRTALGEAISLARTFVVIR